MMDIEGDADALIACVDLVGRTGAKDFQIGYLHDDVPVAEAAWYAHAQYQGARITAQDHPSPALAAEALARRLLDGGRCTHCNGLIALSSAGAMFYPGRQMTDGSRWTDAKHTCRWRRVGQAWVRGCAEGVSQT